MNAKIKDLKGQKFGRLEIKEFNGVIKHQATWKCICDCGKLCIIKGGSIRSGHTKSCGCLSKEIHITHGATNTPEYNTWCNIKDRCLNPKVENFKDYGGRGIGVCERWLLF